MSWKEEIKKQSEIPFGRSNKTLVFDAGTERFDYIGTLTIEPELRPVCTVLNREALKLLKEMLGDRLYIADEDYR